MKKFILLPPILLLTLMTGCLTTSYEAPFKPPNGAIYTNIKAPLTTSYQETPVSKKMGQASSMYVGDPYYTGLTFAWDECDIQTAAKNGKLTKVHYADYSITQILGIFGKTTVTVYGE